MRQPQFLQAHYSGNNELKVVMMVRWMSVLGVCAVLASVPAYGAEPVNVIGGSETSCGKWLVNRERHVFYLDGMWVLGYASGIAVANKRNLLQGTDGEGVWAWMDNYCRTHPLENMLAVADALVWELSAKH
jgi:hypothetical protein